MWSLLMQPSARVSLGGDILLKDDIVATFWHSPEMADGGQTIDSNFKSFSVSVASQHSSH